MFSLPLIGVDWIGLDCVPLSTSAETTITSDLVSKCLRSEISFNLPQYNMTISSRCKRITHEMSSLCYFSNQRMAFAPERLLTCVS